MPKRYLLFIVLFPLSVAAQAWFIGRKYCPGCNSMASPYATWNPGDNGGVNFITVMPFFEVHSSGGSGLIRATAGVTSPQVKYWQVRIDSFFAFPNVGICKMVEPNTEDLGFSINGWGDVMFSGLNQSYTYNNDVFTLYSTTPYAAGDTLGFLLDMGAGTLTIYYNNISQGVAVTGLTGTIYPAASTYAGNTFGYTAWFDPKYWTHTPPGITAANAIRN